MGEQRPGRGGRRVPPHRVRLRRAGQRSWREAWLTPIGAMVVLLVLNLGVTTWLALDAQKQRQHIDKQVVTHRIRNEEVHQQQVALIECFNVIDRPTSVTTDAERKLYRSMLEDCRELYDFNHQIPPKEYGR